MIKEYAIKKEMEKKLEKSLLTTLTIPKKNVHWIENGKELVINGEMFDVKNYSVQNEYLIVCGLFDEYEKQLKKNCHLTLLKIIPLQNLSRIYFYKYLLPT
ncbi:MAG: hypothetical protein IPP48_04190 [Chitinophagaceae bacterium]|nr:hypothetical protein [Chitinophagaceae bacterium]